MVSFIFVLAFLISPFIVGPNIMGIRWNNPIYAFVFFVSVFSWISLIFGIIFFVLGILSLYRIKEHNLKGKIYAWMAIIVSLVILLAALYYTISCGGFCPLHFN